MCGHDWLNVFSNSLVTWCTTGPYWTGHIGFILALIACFLAGVMGKVTEIEFPVCLAHLLWSRWSKEMPNLINEIAEFETTTSINCTPWGTISMPQAVVLTFLQCTCVQHFFFPIINVPSLYLFLNKKQHHFHWLHTKTIRNWWVNHVFLPAIFAATVLNEQIHSSVLFPHTFYLWTTSTPQLSRLAWLTIMAPPSTAYIPPFPFRPSSATSVPSRGWWFGR